MKQGRHDKADGTQREQPRPHGGGGAVEDLAWMAHAAAQHGQPQHQQDVADDGTGDGGLDHVMQSRLERDDGDDEFGGVAEGGVQKPAQALPQIPGEMFSGPAHPGGERQDGGRRGREHPCRIGMDMMQIKGNRHAQQQQIEHHPPPGNSVKLLSWRSRLAMVCAPSSSMMAPISMHRRMMMTAAAEPYSEFTIEILLK